MDTQLMEATAPGASKIYNQFAHYYDRMFSPIYRSRIHSTIRSLDIPTGAEVLEIGIGTGLSLAAYPPDAKVLGIDLSRHMLDLAAERAAEIGQTNVELQVMNATDLQVPDAHFDYVMAFHVASVVDEIDKMMREIFRVCKPGGTIVVINHFRSPRSWIAACMDRITPWTKRLGWRTDLRLDEVVGAVPIHVERRFKTTPFSLFTVVVTKKPVGTNSTVSSCSDREERELDPNCTGPQQAKDC